ncbi:pyruvate/2-oxoglutarate dehydrogenase complex, dihydrolipoamide dehydrogenase component [Chthonomonas calidirosea]|uniref:Pyruvate/2-oxoglutarate dehydrogenase complex,dihydrolipoamide dehydrogenase (E3) component, and related enzymes n=1 Tax=Chthonomonas calidirosea (strain DSM 23976 / ICMP 18418 / T49) TaxID=1303518 RepID=S0ET54_CHTCT|nr:NAD(P)/FAD-dependent oxidoreductase [Chthonomonas calidirosea]CCW34549.1 Pyruvate/2-oxoglutarate dehydrogenase complex,dihydrolipoamide dehydrogenase (E3) component, and related enzymes [Chthonomonas calidirosea T49]CEK14467.1 pyruvate/2-oxoglutarate dehydrogenase complex, dihydrolipoamide dehydrogenase component [Chthonomonas calidirosea]
MESYDLVVIGGGSAGLKAARLAAQMGKHVAVAEARETGGECFWAGCVPTKALLRAAQVWKQVTQTAPYGIHVTVDRADFAEAMAYKARKMREVGGNGPPDAGLSKWGAAFFPEYASFEEPHKIRVGKKVIHAEQVLIATGTVPAIPPISGLKEAGFITNREAVMLTSLPKRLAVIGAGPIGLEFALLFRRFGAEVTVLERLPQVLPREDVEIAERVAASMQQEGIRLILSAHVECVERCNGSKCLHLSSPSGVEKIACDEILVAAGRWPAVGELNLEAAGLAIERNALPVDAYLRTRVPSIWAAGDVTGSPLFTHVASYAGGVMVRNAFANANEPVDYSVTPRCTYIDPEVASVGLTEQEALAAGLKIRVSRYDYADLDRAVLSNAPEGLVKLIVEEASGRILGGHIFGEHASSVIAEIAVCMRNHLPIQAITQTMHAYPSFPEAIEAAAAQF